MEIGWEGELLEVQLDFSNKVTLVTLNSIQGPVIAGLTRNLSPHEMPDQVRHDTQTGGRHDESQKFVICLGMCNFKRKYAFAVMTASFKIIFATLVATAALVACTKDTTPGKVDTDSVSPAAEGTRVITVSFAPQTKTTLEEGLQPRFANGDSILLFTVPEDENETLLTDIRKVKVDGSGNATISTNLNGTLKAFYPASAAVVKNNIVIGEISAVQSGKFADANIAGADINENNSAQFENVAPLLIITPPSGTKKLIVRSLRTIGEGGQRSEMAFPINTSAEEKEQCTVTVLNPDSDGKYYVAFYYDYDVKLSDLSFEALFDASGTTGSIKGIPASKIAQQAAATGIENYEIIKPGIAYTIDGNNWHEYVTIAGRKWATMNVGAESPTELGDYFMWGEVKGHTADFTIETTSQEVAPYNIVDLKVNAFQTDFSAFDFTSDTRYNNSTKNKDDGFSGSNVPFVSSASYEEHGWFGHIWACTFSKYVEESNVLKLCDDAANVNWGGSWRIPTLEEYNALINCGYTWENNYCSSGKAGSTFTENGQTVFFPVSGWGWGLDLQFLEHCFYWSSTPNNGETGPGAYGMDISNGEAIYNVYNGYRYCGFQIRAIIDEPDFIATED